MLDCNLLKTGSLAQPLSRTPREVGSMRKCRTSSVDGSESPLPGVDGGGVATFRARPNAPGNELESLTTKVPGGLSFSMDIALKHKSGCSIKRVSIQLF